MAISSRLLLSSSALLVLAQCTGLSPSWTSEPAGILPIWRSVVLRAAAFSSADLRGGVLAVFRPRDKMIDETNDYSNVQKKLSR